MKSLPNGLKVEAKLFIARDGFIVGGEGLIEILEAVERLGSLSRAAKSLGMPYRKLLSRIAEAERILGVELVERRKGRGRSRLTESGAELVMMYRRAESRLKSCIDNLTT